MLLYHYANTAFPVLKTRAAQGGLLTSDVQNGEEEAAFRRDVGPYYDHVSLFLEPAPLDILGDLFKKVHHSVWVNGATVYEHVIDSAKLPVFKYNLVETPSDIAFMNEHWPEDVELSDEDKKQYFATRAAAKLKSGECGVGNAAFERSARAFVGMTRAAYIKATQHASEEDLMRYATNVPHAMLYPKGGVMHLIQPARAVVIGSKVLRVKDPSYMKW